MNRTFTDISTTKLKILTIVGTRPELIRLSCIIRLLDKFTDHILVHTGQNYDYELNEIFFKDLEIRKPDHFLNISKESLGNSIGDLLVKTEDLLNKIKPDGLLILGDTNSSLSAYMAKRKHIPIFHMEAGNRSFDQNVPEEINRKIIDHLADYNLVYSENARRHLISEGLPHRRIYLTGSPMGEVLDYYRDKIMNSKILTELNLKKKEYFIVSIHREENVDNQYNLIRILHVLQTLVNNYKLPVIISTHPRTRKRMEDLKQKKTDNHKNGINFDNEMIRFMKPFGFHDYNYLQLNALCAVSDSGTISEESAILDFPAISLRQSMERPEAQDSGSIVLTGFDPEVVLNSINAVVEQYNTEYSRELPSEYKVKNCSWRVVKLILGNTRLSNIWSGINE